MSRIKELKTVLQDANLFYSQVRELVLKISRETKTAKLSKEDLCDIGFLSREIISRFEEIRKDVGAMKVLVDKVMCIKVMQDTLMDPTKPDIVKGELASGVPYYKKSVTLPTKDTTDYQEMMDHFGVSSIGQELGVAKIGWKAVCKYVSHLSEMGKPIPKFIPKIHDDYTVTHRRKSI